MAECVRYFKQKNRIVKGGKYHSNSAATILIQMCDFYVLTMPVDETQEKISFKFFTS